MGSLNKNLKAYVRIDASGRVVAGSLVLRKNKPKVGRWNEIQTYECCNDTPTTTTTTSSSTSTTTSTSTSTSTSSSTTTTTTTITVSSFIARAGNSEIEACSSSENQTFYTSGQLDFGLYPVNGITIYFDQALTQPVTYSHITAPGIGRLLDCNNGLLSNQRTCS